MLHLTNNLSNANSCTIKWGAGGTNSANSCTINVQNKIQLNKQTKFN